MSRFKTGSNAKNAKSASLAPLAGRPYAIHPRPLDMTRIRRLSPQYVAGFFDGEGCVDVTNSGALMAMLTNTNLLVLRLIQVKYGGSLDKSPPHPPRKVIFMWKTASRDARRFLEAIYPYLVIKANQARIGICYDIWKEQHNLRAKGADRNGILATRQAVIQLFHKMNRRGTAAI